MSKDQTSFGPLLIAAVLAIGVGYAVPRYFKLVGPAASNTAEPAKQAAAQSIVTGSTAPAGAPATAAKTEWLTSAPGRVEPLGGELRLTAQMPGRVAEILTSVTDTAVAGDPLLRIDDDELIARVAAAEAEASVRRRDRDQEKDPLTKAQQDRRTAEDAAYTAERVWAATRIEFDRLFKARRSGGAKDDEVQRARETVRIARERVEATRATVRKLPIIDNGNSVLRLDASLSAARAEVALADAALERSRVRAPVNGNVLQIYAKAGENAVPSPEAPVLVFGDTSKFQVRAEIEERDAGKVRIGQQTVIRSDAFPGRSFEGKITSVAQALGSSRINAKGPRKPTDVDVLEVMIELDGRPALMSGMRVDVFVKPDSTANSQAAPATKAN
jgi:HlyD family secretion protein